jgi:hypothetical protein
MCACGPSAYALMTGQLAKAALAAMWDTAGLHNMQDDRGVHVHHALAASGAVCITGQVLCATWQLQAWLTVVALPFCCLTQSCVCDIRQAHSCCCDVHLQCRPGFVAVQSFGLV